MSNSAQNNISIIEITPELEKSFFRHVKKIALHLRDCDKDELAASAEHSPYDEVMETYNSFERKWIVIKQEGILNIPIVLFGVIRSEIKDVGIPCMVATSNFPSIKRFIARNSKKYINLIMKDYKFLFNYVDARNVGAVKWLKKCGFTIEKAEPFGHKNVRFHLFHMRGKA